MGEQCGTTAPRRQEAKRAVTRRGPSLPGSPNLTRRGSLEFPVQLGSTPPAEMEGEDMKERAGALLHLMKCCCLFPNRRRYC